MAVCGIRKAEVRAVAIVMRNGVVVGRVPLMTPPSESTQKAKAADNGKEESESSSAAGASEDPF